MQLTGGAGGHSGGDGLLRSNAGIMFGVGAATPATGGSDTTSVIPGCFIAPLRIRATVLRLQPARSVPRHGGYTTGSAPRGCRRAQDRLPRGAPAAAPPAAERQLQAPKSSEITQWEVVPRGRAARPTLWRLACRMWAQLEHSVFTSWALNQVAGGLLPKRARRENSS